MPGLMNSEYCRGHHPLGRAQKHRQFVQDVQNGADTDNRAEISQGIHKDRCLPKPDHLSLTLWDGHYHQLITRTDADSQQHGHSKQKLPKRLGVDDDVPAFKTQLMCSLVETMTRDNEWLHLLNKGMADGHIQTAADHLPPFASS